MPESPLQTTIRDESGNGHSPGDPVVRVRNLNHYYGEGELRKQVLFENRLEVSRGEIVVMTGPSGSGKTTLLTLIGPFAACRREAGSAGQSTPRRGHERAGAGPPQARIHLPGPQLVRITDGLPERPHGGGTVRIRAPDGQSPHHGTPYGLGFGASHPLQARRAFGRAEAARGHRPGPGPPAAV